MDGAFSAFLQSHGVFYAIVVRDGTMEHFGDRMAISHADAAIRYHLRDLHTALHTAATFKATAPEAMQQGDISSLFTFPQGDVMVVLMYRTPEIPIDRWNCQGRLDCALKEWWSKHAHSGSESTG